MLQALCGAGFMVNLHKCKFLVTSGKLLGFQLSGGGYRLADKFLHGWAGVAIPHNLKELQ